MIDFERANDGIVTLTLNDPNSSVNTMNAGFREALAKTVARLKAEARPTGIIIASAKSTFFAGADLNELLSIGEADSQDFFRTLEHSKADLRAIETLGVPVVCLLAGSALGGGWEIALAAHARFALANDKSRFGLPEVGFGLMPGAGGVARMVRLIGIEAALPYLLEGRTFGPEAGVKAGLIHRTCKDQTELWEAARAFLAAHPQSVQPYDEKNFKLPGGLPSSPNLANKLAVAPAMLLAKTFGAQPAPELILSCITNGAAISLDAALRAESRAFVQLLTSKVAKNLINSRFVEMNALKKGLGRPKGIEARRFRKVAVLGAGMMGAGIAYAAARAGCSVLLKDRTLAEARHGKGYSEKILGKMVGTQKLAESEAVAILGRIEPVEVWDHLNDVDLVIEAVFEDRGVKNLVLHETESRLNERAIWGSNTSTLPISGLASHALRPKQFIGLHFFSPVDRMDLVEIIMGEQTSAETLAAAYDFVLQLGKVPIVVRDSRGFFTSRVFASYVNEGMAMVGEGQNPATIEQAALMAGMAVGPLTVADEVSLRLIDRIRTQTEADFQAQGLTYRPHSGEGVARTLVERGRMGKAAQAGFYDYPAGGKKTLWRGLAELFPSAKALEIDDMKDRLLFVQALETVRCLAEGVISDAASANVGSLMGWGFASWTGGALQFIHQYPMRNFVARADELAARFGDRFEVPNLLREHAARGQNFG